ncbi:MAG: polyphosphate kinase 1 [Chitinophagales bacterium]
MNKDRYFDRDLSWLSFNRRVLMETGFNDLRVYDKIKFIAIHGSNLDEFARVRLAQLEALAKDSKSPEHLYHEEVLQNARLEVYQQSILSREILENRIIPELAENGIKLYYNTIELPEKHHQEVMQLFMSKVLTYLQPVIINAHSDIFLEDRKLYFLIHVNAGRRLENLKIVLNIPSDHLPRFFTLSPIDNKQYVIFLDDIIRIGIPTLFQAYTFYGCYSIKLNRDASLLLDDENEERTTFIQVMKKGLAIKKKGEPSRFQYDGSMPPEIVNFCKKNFDLEAGEMLAVGKYLSSSDFFRFPFFPRQNINQSNWSPLNHRQLSLYGNYFDAISKQDYLLHFPYQSYDYVLVFFNLAVLDQQVTEIMATFYRVAQDSHIVNALISAAKNGKKVKAFVELKARFDEANNVYWAEQMAKAGVEITYSLPGIKVHAKAALIKRRERGREKKYAFLGTGNFNERTAGIYSDMGLFTSNPDLCDELEMVFKYLHNLTKPAPFKKLLVSQFGSLEKFISLIDNEIQQARDRRPSGITVKINNLEDEEMIEKLYEASNAGVPVRLMVRSICRLRPGIPGLSGRIQLFRVIGRYLEHSRVFLFHNSGAQDLYLGSADWMARNLRHRVEVVFPVEDKKIKEEILSFLEIQFSPANKTQLLGNNLHPVSWPELPSQNCSQESFYLYLKRKLNS